MKRERNAEICTAYAGGATVSELASRFTVSRTTIRNIIRRAGVYRPYRDSTNLAPGDVEREAFLGVNLTPESKAALRVKAEEEGVSMSRLVSDAVDEMVK